MKNIFKIHPLTYLILVSVLLCGYFNYFLVISFILITHDLGHIILIKIFKYQINKITILPFGSNIETNVNANSLTKEVFLISVAGIVMQLLLYPLMFFLNGPFINDISYGIFLKYNQILLLFNLLPIIPLDGSKILQCLLESFFSYKQALKMVNFISLVMIICFTLYLGFIALNSYLIIFFLVFKTYETMINHQYMFQHFLVGRHLKKHQYCHIKNIKNIKQLYKNRYNFINHQNEDKVLANYFQSSNKSF